jgi:hypothetical protein
VAGPDRQCVVAGEGGFVISRPAHQPLAGGLAEGEPEADPGAAPTSASSRSSTVLMKCDWPKTKLAESGLTIGTTASSMAELLQGELQSNGRLVDDDCKS